MKSLALRVAVPMYLALSATFVYAQTPEQVRPNFLVIMIDDLNDYVGILGGHPQVRTPNIDRLARRGTLFKQAYSNSLTCGPSRTSLLTGKAVSYTKIANNDDFAASPTFRGLFRPSRGNEVIFTIPEVLKDSGGYFTFAINKTFHGREMDFEKASFPDCGSGLSWHKMITWGGYCQKEIPLGGTPYYCLNDGIPEVAWGRYVETSVSGSRDRKVADTTIAFIEAYTNDPVKYCNSPFFATVGFYRPHVPWFAPETFFPEYYREDLFEEPFEVNFNDPPGRQPPNGYIMAPQPGSRWADTIGVPPLGRNFFSRHHSAFNSFADTIASLPIIDPSLTDAERRDIIEEALRAQAAMSYVASVQWIDHEVGRVLDELDAHPELASNTIVVLLSDHGQALGEKTTWTKPNLWETGMRIPLVIVDPKRPGNQVVEQVVSLLDLFPTLMELSGTPEPTFPSGSRYLDGFSLVPLLDDPGIRWNRAVTASHRQTGSREGSCFNQQSIRGDRFHYIRYRSNGDVPCDLATSEVQEELYEIGCNREVDPEEWNNLADDSAYAGIKRYLKQWSEGGAHYLTKTFEARIEHLEPVCSYTLSDTLQLGLRFQQIDGSELPLPGGYEAAWTIRPGGLAIDSAQVEFPLSLLDTNLMGDDTILLVELTVTDTATGVVAVDVLQVFLTSALPSADFNLSLNGRGDLTIVDFHRTGPRPVRTEWRYSDGFTFEGELGPDRPVVAPGTYEVSYEASYGGPDSSCNVVISRSLHVDSSALSGQPCQPPFPVEVSDTDYDAAMLTWSPVFAASGYQARVRPQWPADAGKVESPWLGLTAVQVPSLSSMTAYDFQVRAQCDTALSSTPESDWSYPVAATTLGCEAPLQLRAEILSPTTGVIRWRRPPNATSVDLRIEETELGTARQVVGLTEDSILIDQFIPDGNYWVQARSVCPRADSSAYRGDDLAEGFFSTPSLRQAGAEGWAELSLSPNPATNRLLVSYSGSRGPVQLTVAGLDGRIWSVHHGWSDQVGRWSMELNLQNIPEGLYSVKISDRQGAAVRQFVRLAP